MADRRLSGRLRVTRSRRCLGQMAWVEDYLISCCGVWEATTDAEERVRCSLYNTMVWLYVAV